ncbi:hypothetical protein [Nonomuraea sp. NPDC049400]|uniref:hypothetical protein n=1 Tax=Nonomuraea sp. NPDC049400 TaxID=3364352 RepID=UPI0037B5EED8
MGAFDPPTPCTRRHWHCGPECGTVSGHFPVDAASFVEEAGYNPQDHPKLVIELDFALREAVVDTAAEVMREHGLKPASDLDAPIHTPTGDSTDNGGSPS